MKDDLVARVRRFNRTVTQRVGALEDAYLSRSRSLGQARLLWEIGSGGREVRELRATLGLDSGYLSRMLRTLEDDGLIVVETDAQDARVRTAVLTAAGRAEWEILDKSSDQLAAAILDPLSETQRQRLAAAMGEVERLLLASQVEVAVTDPREPEARYCLRAYFAELGERFDTGFDPAHSISAEDHELIAPSGLLLVATLQGRPVGCGALKFHSGEPVAEIKRMWTAPTVRGLGLGRRLLSELEDRARGHDARTLRLETNRALAEAIQLYRSSGFTEVEAFNDEPYAHHWFEKHLA